MSKLYLLKTGEISLKGLNRIFFEKKLKNNIKDKLYPFKSVCQRQKGRLYFEIEDSASDEFIECVLSTTFGLSGFARAESCEKDWETICRTVNSLIESGVFADGHGTFKVESKREDKSFPLSSYNISCELGGLILDKYPSMTVNVRKPDKVLYVEVRDKVYLYTSPSAGLNGLPVGTAGKAITLLSGGIDSPVAAFRMAQRGLRQECLYFHAYPYTSDQAKEKVVELARLLSPYLQGTLLHIVDFTEAELWIRDHSLEDEHTLMMRAAMVKVANMVAEKSDALVLVTGESLSQVASQTLESLCFTESMSDRPVFRPLIGMDKQEIVRLSEKIGTYETSILPYEDCCVVFSPKHPIVRPDKKIETEHYSAMGIEPLLEKAVATIETVALDVRDSCR